MKTIGLKILGRGTVVQTLLLVYLLSVISALALGSSYELLLNTGNFIQGFELRNPMLMDSSARSLYTSVIPERLAKEIETVLGFKARAVTATLGYVDGLLTPIWDYIILGEYSPNVGDVTGCILGEGLAKKLSKNVGDTILVTGILSKEIHILRIAGIRRFNDVRDNYLFVSIDLAKNLRGIRQMDASIIVFDRAEEVREVSKYLSETYELKVFYDVPVEAKLRILASDGSMVSEKVIVGRDVEVIKLPFGYYQPVLLTSYANIPLDPIKLKDSSEVNVGIKGNVILRIIDCPAQLELKDVKGVAFKPEGRNNGTCLYRIPVGVYVLNYSGNVLEIPMIDDLELRLSKEVVKEPEPSKYFKLRIEVRYIDGKLVEDVYLTVLSVDGGLITSTRAKGIYDTILQEGGYIFIVRRGGYVHEEKVTVDGDKTISVTLPLRSDGRIPYSYTPKVKTLPSGYDSLSSISLMVFSAELGLLATISVIAFLVYGIIFDHFFESSSKELEKVREMKFGTSIYLKLFYIPMFTLVLMMALLGSLTALWLAKEIPWPILLPMELAGSILWPYLISVVPAIFSYTFQALWSFRRRECN
jgi:hypothetical protein